MSIFKITGYFIYFLEIQRLRLSVFTSIIPHVRELYAIMSWAF
jgi:hypothetical protein